MEVRARRSCRPLKARAQAWALGTWIGPDEGDGAHAREPHEDARAADANRFGLWPCHAEVLLVRSGKARALPAIGPEALRAGQALYGRANAGMRKRLR